MRYHSRAYNYMDDKRQELGCITRADRPRLDRQYEPWVVSVSSCRLFAPLLEQIARLVPSTRQSSKLLIPVLRASRGGGEVVTILERPCLARIRDRSCDIMSAKRSVDARRIDECLTLGPAGPSRTAHTAEPQTIQLLHRQFDRSLHLLDSRK